MNKLMYPAMALGLAIFATSVGAQTNANSGLGQNWPNASDVSASPHYHVYLFMRDGVRYVQVNEANGNVVGAYAVAGLEVLTLPIGQQAVAHSSRAHVAQATPQTVSPSNSVPLYHDQTMQLAATPQADGTTTVTVLTCDPVECSTHINQPQ